MGEPREFEELDRELWRLPLRTPTLPPATRTNTYVLGRKHLCIVDPAPVHGGEREKLLAFLEQRRTEGATLVALVLTHHHRDHVGAARFLHQELGVQVIAHAETASRVDVPVSSTLADAAQLPCDGPPWTSVFTPGHAAGHLAFWRKLDRTLITGDMVAGTGTILVDPDEGSMSEYMKSLHRLHKLAPDSLLPAHGPELEDGTAALEQYIEHRQGRAAAVLQRVKMGDRTPERIVPHVYTDVAPSVHALAARSVLSILIQHREEGRVVQDQEGTWRSVK